jgi:hypothetical protein
MLTQRRAWRAEGKAADEPAYAAVANLAEVAAKLRGLWARQRLIHGKHLHERRSIWRGASGADAVHWALRVRAAVRGASRQFARDGTLRRGGVRQRVL